jgi:predicted RNase H-like HicB family nuclease
MGFLHEFIYLFLFMKFTATIEKGENGWLVGQIKEVPAALSQGKNIEELKANLLDALVLLLNIDMKDIIVSVD